MKPLLVLALGLLALPTLPAETVDLGTHGSLSLAVPKGWTLGSQKVEGSGIAVTLTPPADINARLLLNVTFVTSPEPVSNDRVDEEVNSVCDQFVEQSVEKKKTLRNFNLSSGAYGAYCIFTDASLVGQAPKKDEFKVIGVGVIKFSDEVMAAVSIASDDAKGADFGEMLGAVESAKLARR